MTSFDSIDRRIFLLGGASLIASGGASAQSAPPAPLATLEAAAAELQIRAEPRPKTKLLSFNGAVPGPVIRVKQGDSAMLRIVNRLDQPTSLHVQGLRPPFAQDGVAGLSGAGIAAGATLDLPLATRDAGTFLYRPMIQGRAEAQMDAGLYGALIVEEKNPPPADREMLLVLDDWRLNAESQLQTAETLNQGAPPVAGNVLTVNGAPRAVAENAPPGARLRLRIVNAATARIMALRFEGESTVIAIDGQPSSTAFRPKNGVITLTPGGRIDVMADMPKEAGKTYKIFTALSPEVTVPVLEVTAEGSAARTAPLPPVAALPPNPIPERLELARAQRAECVIGGGPGATGPAKPWLLNGAALTALDKAKPLFKAKPGTTVVLSFRNQTAIPQPMTAHGHHGRLLFVFDDGWDPFWTDTVLVQPGKTARFAFIADNPGRWLIRSAYAALFDAGVAAVFEVG